MSSKTDLVRGSEACWHGGVVVVYRWRWAVLVVSVVLLGGFIYSLMTGGTLGTGNSPIAPSRRRAAKLINEQLSTGASDGANFLLTFSSPDQLATDPEFQTELENALAPIQSDPHVSVLDWIDRGRSRNR